MSGIGVVNQYGILMVRPGVSTYADASDTRPATGRLTKEMLVIGPSPCGDPNKLYRFTSPGLAKKMIGEGAVALAVTDEEMIDPIRLMALMQHPSKSPDVHGAFTINFLRVGEPTRANWLFQNATAADVLDIWSVDYGLEPNKIRMRFEAGTYVKEGVNTYVKDEKISRTYSNIGRAIYVKYSGAGTACVMTITPSVTTDEATRLQILVDGNPHVDMDLMKYSTIASVVSALNGYSDIAASVSPYANTKMPAATLDPVTAKSIKQLNLVALDAVGANSVTKTGAFAGMSLSGRLVNVNTTDGTTIRPRVVTHSDDTLTFDGIWDLTGYSAMGKNASVLEYTANSILLGIAWTLNQQETARVYVQKMSTAIGAAYDKPATVDYQAPSTFGKYLSADTAPGFPGLTDTLTNTDWVNALEKAERMFKKNGAIIALTHSTSIGLLFDAYSRKQMEYYARFLYHFAAGGDADTDWDDGQEIARDLGSIYTTAVFNCPELYDADGNLEFTTPLYGAAMCAGMWVGSGIRNPLTGNSLACHGLKYRWSDDQETALIESGGTVLSYDEDTTDGVSGIVVLLALTTWTGDNKSIWRRLYGMTVVSEINQLLKQACWPLFYGKRITANVGQSIQNKAKTILEALALPTSDQLLIADPSDPINKPAFTMPRFSMTGDGGGYLECFANIVDEGNYLLISCAVQFQTPTFE